MPLLAIVVAPLHADDWAPNITTTATWNSNASNANLDSDQIDSLQTSADILASQRYGIGRNDSIHLAGHFRGEWWPRYEELLQGSAGARAEWQHKFGLGPLAPIVSFEAAIDQVEAREDGRRGTTTGFTFSLRKRFNDVFRATLAHAYTDHAAKYAVFDRKGHETTLQLDRDLGNVTRFTLAIGHRDGDVLSYATPPRPDLVDIARERLDVVTFGRPMVAYSVDARTWSARAALTRALDESSAVVAGYEWRRTEREPLRYVNHLVSIALVYQF